jgi:hypothetical protein
MYMFLMTRGVQGHEGGMERVVYTGMMRSRTTNRWCRRCYAQPDSGAAFLIRHSLGLHTSGLEQKAWSNALLEQPGITLECDKPARCRVGHMLLAISERYRLNGQRLWPSGSFRIKKHRSAHIARENFTDPHVACPTTLVRRQGKEHSSRPVSDSQLTTGREGREDSQ